MRWSSVTHRWRKDRRKPCKSGSYRHSVTGHCRKDKRKACKPGSYRHSKTGRCRKDKVPFRIDGKIFP